METPPKEFPLKEFMEFTGEVLTVLSAAGVHGHCYCRCVHSPVYKCEGRAS